MKGPRDRERKAPSGLYHGSVQVTNWTAQIVASTLEDNPARPLWKGRNVIAVLVTYPNQQCGMLQLTSEEFRSLAWLDRLHIDAITYVFTDAERRWIAEAIQLQGVPELTYSETFDKICDDLLSKLCDEERIREGTCIAA